MASADASHCVYMDGTHEKFGQGDAFIGKPVDDFCTYMDMPFVDADVASHNEVSPQSTFYSNSDINSELGARHPAMQFGIDADTTCFLDSPQCYFGQDFSFELLPSNEVITANITDETGEFRTESSCSVSDISMIDYSDVKGLNFKSEASNCMSPLSGNFSSNADDRHVDIKSSGMPFSCIQSAIKDRQLASIEGGITNEAVDRKLSCSDETTLFVEEETKQSSSMPIQKHLIYIKNEKASRRAGLDGVAGKIPLNGAHLQLNAPVQYSSCVNKSKINKLPSFAKEERDSKLIQPMHLGHLSSISPESYQNKSSGSKSNVDDDNDLCILEDISQPARINHSAVVGKANTLLQHSAYGDSVHYTGTGGTRLRTNDERFIFRAALQVRCCCTDFYFGTKSAGQIWKGLAQSK